MIAEADFLHLYGALRRHVVGVWVGTSLAVRLRPDRRRGLVSRAYCFCGAS